MASTVTEQEAVFPPSFVLTVIVVVPALTAVTVPLLSTDATDDSDEDHVTSLSVALEGDTVATRDSLAPSTRVMEDLFNDTPLTEILAGVVGVGFCTGSGSGPPQPLIRNIDKANALNTLLIVNIGLNMQFSQIYKKSLRMSRHLRRLIN